MINTVTLKDLKPVLMEKTEQGVKIPNYVIEDNGQAILVVSPGLNGMEFNKTVGFLSNFPGMQTYICLYGSGLLLMQRNDGTGEAKEFKVATLVAQKSMTVPAGWMMCLVNTGNKNYLVVLRNSSLEDQYLTSKPILEKRGLAYYVVEKKGEIAFEQNPNYSIHPQISPE